MRHDPRFDYGRDFRETPVERMRPYLDSLREQARAAEGERRREILDDLHISMITFGFHRYPGVVLRNHVAENRELLLKRALEFDFDPKRGDLDEFATSHMRGEALEDGTPAVRWRAELR